MGNVFVILKFLISICDDGEVVLPEKKNIQSNFINRAKKEVLHYFKPCRTFLDLVSLIEPSNFKAYRKYFDFFLAKPFERLHEPKADSCQLT